MEKFTIALNIIIHLTFGINDPADLNKPYVQIQGKAVITTDQNEKNN